jgi:hypothetical protein
MFVMLELEDPCLARALHRNDCENAKPELRDLPIGFFFRIPATDAESAELHYILPVESIDFMLLAIPANAL